MADWMQWNELVPEANRIENCPNQGGRSAAIAKPSHVILHITGTKDFATAKRRFMDAAQQASAHYMIDKDGSLHQLVVDGRRAWHAGIQGAIKALYDAADHRWKQYLGLTLARSQYPADAVYLDANLQPTPEVARQRFVRTKDGSRWAKFAYFEQRWGPNRAQPWNYENSKLPNDYSIGVEIVSFGAPRPSATAYTEPMYATLTALIKDLAAKYDIPRSRGRIVGHEDVHPVDRFGWDPAAGFDWDRVLS
jgi:N-acetyl-anhydromuramyl-L-alanine amidase AmpD